MAVRTHTPSGYRRRSRNNLLAAVILSVSILAAGFVASQSQVQQKPAVLAPVVGQFDVVTLPVPVDYVPAGTKVKDIRFKNVNFPKHQVPDGALKSVGQFTESVVMAPLPANLPLFESNFGRIGDAKNPVVERIPAGMRAMTVRVDATSAVEGWAGSGSIVDVLLVGKDRTTVIAEKVKILSAERSLSPVESASSPQVPSTVTLLVTQEQCLAINTAIPNGRIAFALRSSRDEENWEDTYFVAERLRGPNAASKSDRSSVNGYVSYSSEGGNRSFALTNGRWVKTEAVPEGFGVGQAESGE